MARTSDKHRLRAILNQDRAWAVYPLGDLEDRYFAACEWHVRESSFLLLYRGAPEPVLVAGGDPAVCAALIDEAGHPTPLQLHVRPELVPYLKTRYKVVTTRDLLRMRLAAANLLETPRVERLGPDDLPELLRLYDAPDGPDFFFPDMLRDNTYFGIRVDGELVAAAGTHLVSDAESVAAIGNVFTHARHRGRGFGAETTSAVVRTLCGRGIETIALSVIAANCPAIRVYERLGLTVHCPFVDGTAT